MPSELKLHLVLPVKYTVALGGALCLQIQMCCMTVDSLFFKLPRQDLKETFIDSGVMSAIKEWLSPLPDRSLPALKIREELLKILQEVLNCLLTVFHPWAFSCALGKGIVLTAVTLLVGPVLKCRRKQPQIRCLV